MICLVDGCICFLFMLDLVCPQGNGRAFCAGGDVATVVRDVNAGKAYS